MKRRAVLRNLVFVSAGAVLLPACFQEQAASIVLKNISISASEEKILKALAEAIIPETKSFIGAKSLKSHEFILTMIDDCVSPADQKFFTDGIKAFDQVSHDQFGQLFTGFTKEQKKELLSAIESKKNIPDDVVGFYETVKHYTVQSFVSSKEYMVGVRKYKQVPGPNFKGCVKV
jgi:hypothetical protein